MAEPIKTESLLTYLGFEADKIKTEEDFKTNFETKFGIKDQLIKDESFVAPIFGKRIGSISAKLLTTAHRMGIDMTRGDADKMKVEEMIDFVFDKTAEMNRIAIEEMEKERKGTVEEQVKTWKDKYAQVERERNEFKGMSDKTAIEFNDYKKDQVNKSKFDTINGFKKSSLGKLEFKQDISAVEKAGFESVLNDKYDFDLDENQEPFIKDKKTGQRIASKKITGTFMSADEILQEELIANKLAKINKDGGKPAPKYGQINLGSEQATENKIFIHPRARMAANM